MNFICIRKKHILIAIFIISSISISVYSYLTYFINRNECDDNHVVYIDYSDNDNGNDKCEESFLLSYIQDRVRNIYNSDEKIAYLTFDDGPTKIATPKILDILKENDVKGNFFVIGYRVEEFPNIVKRAYEEGHFIANHGYSHKNNKLYKDKSSFINEILNADQAIANAIGIPSYHSHIFRFPNGSKSTAYNTKKAKCKEYLEEIGYTYIDWNALNNDSLQKYSNHKLLSNLKNSCKNKNVLVILMHDTSDVSKSYESLDDSIKYLKEQGYSFKTFEELFI